MEKCERCGEERELVPNTVICRTCHGEILKKNFGKQYHPTEVAEKLDKLEKRISDIESRFATY